MSKESIIITVIAADRSGIVQRLSDTALAHKASWKESSLSHLQGQFAGIVNLEVETTAQPALLQALAELAGEGINVTVHGSQTESRDIDFGETAELYVEANDRPGIVEEITSALAEVNVNVEQIETWCESASMAGYELFIAQLSVSLPSGLRKRELEAALEGVSDDLVVVVDPD
jgi:glycine cleavage system regulatory protein